MLICYFPFFNLAIAKQLLLSTQFNVLNFDGFSSINILTKAIGLSESNFIPSLLVLVVLIIVLIIYFFNNPTWQSTLNKLFLGYTVFLLFVEEVQPFHIVCLILFSTFAKNYTYAILWSILILISNDSFLIILGGKLIVFCWMLFELFKNKQLSN